MKLLKVCSALALVVSLNASEIKPFGGFEFGDSITPTIEKICSMKSVNKIKFSNDGYSWSQILTKDEFCSDGKNKISKALSQGRIGNVPFSKEVTIGNINKFYLIVESVNIKGVPFNLVLDMFKKNYLNGQYLMVQDDTINITKKMKVWSDEHSNNIVKNVKFKIPLMMHSISLETTNKTLLEANRKDIYNLLKNKYSNMIKKNKRNEKYLMLDIRGDNKTKLSFSHNLKYTKKMESSFDNEYKKYLQNQQSSKPDSSGGL